MTLEVTEDATDKELAWNFMDAVEAGDFDAVRALHSKTPSIVNAATVMGPVIYVAAGKPSADMLRMLLELGAEPNVRRRNTRRTPISSAASKGFLENGEMLFYAGAVLDTSDMAANPLIGAIHAYVPRATRETCLDVAEYLLDAGIDSSVRYRTTRIIGWIAALDFAWEMGARHIARAIAERELDGDEDAIETRLAQADRTARINTGLLPAPGGT